MKLYYKQPEVKEDYDKCPRNEDKRHDDYKCDYDDRKRDWDDRKRDCDDRRCDWDDRRCHCDDRRCDFDDRRCDFDDRCCDRHKFAHCCPKNPCPYPILFECAQGSCAEITKTVSGGQGQGQGNNNVLINNFSPRSLGCVTIDTTCLKNPVVKFDFCSIIKLISGGDTTEEPVTLTFELCKTCDEGHEICCGSWTFVGGFDEQNEQLTTSFCFSHCECNSCPGCCTYTVKLINAVNTVSGTIVEVKCPTLSVIAKSGC